MWLVFIAQESAPSSPTVWLQYGALGLVIVALLLGWLWPRPPVDRLLRDNDRLRDQVDERLEALTEEVRALRKELERRGPADR